MFYASRSARLRIWTRILRRNFDIFLHGENRYLPPCQDGDAMKEKGVVVSSSSKTTAQEDGWF